jgi:hypothetical protein
MKQFNPPGRAGRRSILRKEAPVEELGLSVRTRNAVRGMGCVTIDDVLHLNLSSSWRGMGEKTKAELLTALERAGFEHPCHEAQPDSEIQMLDRRLARVQDRIDRALESVAKEIRIVRRKLNDTIAARKGRPGAPADLKGP